MDRVEKAWFDRELAGGSFGDERLAKRLSDAMDEVKVQGVHHVEVRDSKGNVDQVVVEIS